MPIDRKHRRSDRLLQLPCDPPVILRVERADRNRPVIEDYISRRCRQRHRGNIPRTARDRELVFVGTPPDKRGRAVDAQ